MFCTKCGAQIPDDAKFCPVCSQATDAAPAPAVTYAAPATPVSRNQYLFKDAPKATKTLNLVSIAAGVLCILLLILSVNSFLNGSLFEIPLMKLALESEGVDLDDVEDQLDDMIDLLEDIEDDEDLMYEFEREYDVDLEELEDEYDISIKDFRKLIDPVSFSSIVKLSKFMADGEDEVRIIFTVIHGIIIGITCLLVLVSALAVLFRKTWIAIVAYVISFGFIAFTGGFVYWLLATVAYVASAVLYSKVDGSYKLYLKSIGA